MELKWTDIRPMEITGWVSCGIFNKQFRLKIYAK